MKSGYVAPGFDADAFNCPHCGAYAHQQWLQRVEAYERAGPTLLPRNIVHELGISRCAHCGEHALWLAEEMIYPAASIAPVPAEDMPEDVKDDSETAIGLSCSTW